MAVLVTDEMAVAARAREEETLRRFANFAGHYDNTSDSHFRGKIGELDCAQSVH